MTRRFGKYRLEKLLARGPRSEVFLAVERGPLAGERHVIIKRLRQTAVHDADSRTSFLERSRTALALSHPNLVRAYQSGAEGGVVYLALEYVRGGSVGAALQYSSSARRQLSADLVLWVGRQVAAALEHVHGATDVRGAPLGLAHGAVAPANILLGFDGGVKLADFGVAGVALGDSEPARTSETHPAYQAPEQVAGGSMDPRSDLFALGVVMHEMLTGRPLFRGKNDLDTMTRLCEGRIPSPCELRPECPPALAAVILRALQRDPAERYRSAGAMLADLEAVDSTATLLEMRREINAVFEREDRGDPTIPKVRRQAPAEAVVEVGAAPLGETAAELRARAASDRSNRTGPGPGPARFDSDWGTRPLAQLPGRLVLPLPAPDGRTPVPVLKAAARPLTKRADSQPRKGQTITAHGTPHRLAKGSCQSPEELARRDLERETARRAAEVRAAALHEAERRARVSVAPLALATGMDRRGRLPEERPRARGGGSMAMAGLADGTKPKSRLPAALVVDGPELDAEVMPRLTPSLARLGLVALVVALVVVGVGLGVAYFLGVV